MKRWKSSVEVIKAITEVLAILIGGSWAYYHFVLTEKPSLEPSLSANSSVDWVAKSPMIESDYCLTYFNVELSNDQKVPDALKKAKVRLWVIPQVKMTSKGNASPEGPEAFINNMTPPTLGPIVTDKFDAIYLPETKYHDFYLFLIRKQAGIAIFKFYGWAKQPQDWFSRFIEKARWEPVSTYTMDEICGGQGSNYSSGN